MPTSDELYEQVVREGGRRRRRTLRALAAVGVVLVVVVAAVALRPGDGDHTTVAATDTSSSSSGSSPTSSSSSDSSSASSAASASSETIVPTTSSEATVTDPSSTPPDCRNNVDDPTCGPLYWDPPIVNQPITGSLQINGAVHASQPTTLSVQADDPDAGIFMCFSGDQDVSTTEYSLSESCARVACALVYRGYGPHDPPPPHPSGPQSQDVALTFDAPGTYHLSATIISWGEHCAGSVYDNTATLTLDVTVLP